MATTTQQWDDLWAGIDDLTASFPSIVFIGGVAVYLHVAHRDLPEGFIEYSHDGDFCISLADFSDLRNYEDVTANRRLNKHQIIKRGIDFDIYLEQQSGLRVGYADLQFHSDQIDDVRVACIEHLLLLKIDAYQDRKGSQKGAKDERDLIRIMSLCAADSVRSNVLAPYLTEESVELLATVQRSREFLTICQGNAHAASQLRKSFLTALPLIRNALP